QVTAKGQIFCLDANGASQPIHNGNVDIMEIDAKHVSDDVLSKLEDTDDSTNTAHLSNIGKFEISGYENEWTEVPEFYLRFNLPCPPVSYCTDPIYRKRCPPFSIADESESTVAFTYLMEENQADTRILKASYDVKCYLGVKTSEGIEEGFSCSGGLTP
ncbi:hypothetical protein PFISCL1PPCAC_17219, partial [Pristionchus fissidentatus]